MIKIWFISFFLLVLSACQEQNIVLVNEIKTLDAKWVRVSEQITDLGKMLPKWTVQMEDSKTILQEMEFSSVEMKDSILTEQAQIVLQVNRVSDEFDQVQLQFENKIQAFTAWQQQALKISGENPDQIKTELQKFQEEFEVIREALDSVRNKLHALAQNHNDLRKSLLEENEWVQYEAITIR
jgi:chromosome segregation ATPase